MTASCILRYVIEDYKFRLSGVVDHKNPANEDSMNTIPLANSKQEEENKEESQDGYYGPNTAGQDNTRTAGSLNPRLLLKDSRETKLSRLDQIYDVLDRWPRLVAVIKCQVLFFFFACSNLYRRIHNR